MRHTPKNFYGKVFDAVTGIVRASESGNIALEQTELARLRALYTRHEAFGYPDPFLMEAVADYTVDARGGWHSLRALASPDEPTHTKRICLAERLVELGDLATARAELMLGRAEAERLHDDDYVKTADELLAKVGG